MQLQDRRGIAAIRGARLRQARVGVGDLLPDIDNLLVNLIAGGLRLADLERIGPLDEDLHQPVGDDRGARGVGIVDRYFEQLGVANDPHADLSHQLRGGEGQIQPVNRRLGKGAAAEQLAVGLGEELTDQDILVARHTRALDLVHQDARRAPVGWRGHRAEGDARAHRQHDAEQRNPPPSPHDSPIHEKIHRFPYDS